MFILQKKLGEPGTRLIFYVYMTLSQAYAGKDPGLSGGGIPFQIGDHYNANVVVNKNVPHTPSLDLTMHDI